MTLRTSLLRQLENPNLSVDGRAELRCESAREFEDKGEYEDAREVLGDLWTRIGEKPKVEGLQASMAAEVLMRVGVLTGAIGSKHQVADAQETAKNLISQSLTIFCSLNYKKKIAEAQIELALCYWRTGEYDEGRDLLKDILKRQTMDGDLRAKAALRLAIVERAATNYAVSLSVLMEHSVLFQKINNQTIKGSYHVTLGTVLENLWELEKRGDYLDRSLIEYAAASYHFEQAGHRCYRANVENNLGFLYFKINRCKKAHEHLDKARRILASLKDRVTLAQVDETRARVFLKQKRNVEAEKVARLSVRTLEESDRQSLLAEALITHGRALGRLERYSVALSTFRRAIDISEHNGNLNTAREAALTAFQEIGEHLTSDDGQSLPAGRKFTEAIRRFEHDLLKHALDESQGSVTYAARRLGISHQSLGYMMLAVARHFPKAEAEKAFRVFVSWVVRFLVYGGARSGNVEEAYSERAKEVTDGKIVLASDLIAKMADVLPTDPQFKTAFAAARVSKNSLARYYLRALELKAKDDPAPDLIPNEDPLVVNLEHVLPENPGDGWGHIAPELAVAFYKRIGNMVLLKATSNSIIGNSSFDDKKPVLAESGLILTRDVATQLFWGPDEINKRQESLAELAVKTWPLAIT